LSLFGVLLAAGPEEEERADEIVEIDCRAPVAVRRGAAHCAKLEEDADEVVEVDRVAPVAVARARHLHGFADEPGDAHRVHAGLEDGIVRAVVRCEADLDGLGERDEVCDVERPLSPTRGVARIDRFERSSRNERKFAARRRRRLRSALQPAWRA